MATRRVLSVGQCDLDHGNISRELRERYGCEVVRARTADDALAALKGGGLDLVLVNRVFDADGGSGLALVEQVRGVPVMLVSNFADAQEQAVAAGAVPGFGKAALTAPQTHERLGKYLGGER